MFADTRSSIETSCSSIECASRRETSSTPTLSPLQISGSAAAAPTWLALAPSRQASECWSFRKSLLTHIRRSRKACPETPEPSGVPATIEMPMLRRRGTSSPQPAAKRRRLVSGSSRKIATARKSPTENAASQTFAYSSSGDLAYRIASLVAFNAANVRAISVFTVPKLPAGSHAAPADFMRAAGLNARYWRSGVAIQSKCQTNEPRCRSGELRALSRFVSHTGGACAGRDAGLALRILRDEIRKPRGPCRQHG